MLGRTGWSVRQGDETTRKDWCLEEPAFWEGTGSLWSHWVIYSLFSRFPTLQNYFGDKVAQGLCFFGHWPFWPSFPVSHQVLLFSSIKMQFHIFSPLSNLHTTARLLFLKYLLDHVSSLLKNLSVLSTVTGSSIDTHTHPPPWGVSGSLQKHLLQPKWFNHRPVPICDTTPKTFFVLFLSWLHTQTPFPFYFSIV